MTSNEFPTPAMKSVINGLRALALPDALLAPLATKFVSFERLLVEETLDSIASARGAENRYDGPVFSHEQWESLALIEKQLESLQQMYYSQMTDGDSRYKSDWHNAKAVAQEILRNWNLEGSVDMSQFSE